MPHKAVHSATPEDWIAGCRTGAEAVAVIMPWAKNAGQACAGKAGDDVRVAGAVDVADLVRVLALLPFG